MRAESSFWKRATMSCKGGCVAIILLLVASVTRALVAAYLVYAWTHLRWVPRPGYPSTGMGDAALHLGLFEQPERKGFFGNPARRPGPELHLPPRIAAGCRTLSAFSRSTR